MIRALSHHGMIFGLLLLVCTLLVGCQKNKTPQMTAPPPPRGETLPSAEVREVAPGMPVASEPVVFEEVPPAPRAANAAAVSRNTGATVYGGSNASSHTVQKGDTLWSIAKRHYGDGKRWKDIQSANPGINPTRLIIGQTLVLP